MPLAIAVAAAGALSAGASIYAAHSASSAASHAADENNALQTQIYNSNKGLEQPYIQGGNKAETALQGFLGLGGDPAASQRALNDYLGSTGYQFNRQQGLDAVTQSKAAAGLLGSGATLKALDDYGTGLADQYGQQYVGNLQDLAHTGANSANALAGQGQTYANAVSSNNNSAASASGNAALTNANAFNGFLNTALGALGMARGQSSYGGGNAFNAATAQLGG